MTLEINKINSIYQTDMVGAPRRNPRKHDPKQTSNTADVHDRVSLSYRAPKKQGTGKSEQDLTPEEKQQLNELKKRDAEVRAHEQAHMAAGGGLVTGGASYQYQVGPDGKRYAVNGEVTIDVSPERTPEATIRKMQQVKRAALAPVQPSATDRAVAARATQLEAKARAEKAEQEREEAHGEDADHPLVAEPESSDPLENSDRRSGINGDHTPAQEKGRQVNLFS